MMNHPDEDPTCATLYVPEPDAPRDEDDNGPSATTDVADEAQPLALQGVAKINRINASLTFGQLRGGDYTGIAWANGNNGDLTFELFDTPPPYHSRDAMMEWFDTAPYLTSDYHINIDPKRRNTSISLGINSPELKVQLMRMVNTAEQHVYTNAANIWPTKSWTADPDKVRDKMDGVDDDALFRPGVGYSNRDVAKVGAVYVTLVAKLFSHANDTDRTQFTRLITPTDVDENGEFLRNADGDIKMTELAPEYFTKGSKVVATVALEGLQRLNTTNAVKLQLKVTELIAFDPKLIGQMARAGAAIGDKRAHMFHTGEIETNAPPPKRFVHG